MRLAGHAWVHPRQRLPPNYTNHESVSNSDDCSVVPRGAAEELHSNDIEKREQPAHDDV